MGKFDLKPHLAELLDGALTDRCEPCPLGQRKRWTGKVDGYGRAAYYAKAKGHPLVPADKQFYEQVMKCGPVEEGWKLIHDCGDELCFACLREIDPKEQARRIEQAREEAYRLLAMGLSTDVVAKRTGVAKAHLDYVKKNKENR